AIVFMLDWRIFLMLFVVFIGIVLATRYISAGSVICSVMYPILLNRMNDTGIYMIEFVAIAIAVLVVIRHRGNLKRIFDGTESKFVFKKSKKTVSDGEK
ncbi:MAG: glycerol-3-phosphate acyltransferase, partial [Eubacteriales bacterium]